MANIYDKIDAALKRIREIQSLIREGVARPAEKNEAFEMAKSIGTQFPNDIFQRKAEKLSKVTIWSKQSRDGFVAADEAGQLNDWIALLEEYKEGRKIKTNLSSEKTNIHSVVDGEDQHTFITEIGTNEHVHLISDGGTGETRIDPKDRSPHELIKSVETKLELKTGETVRITRNTISFVEPEAPTADVKVYTASKDGYSVLEIYNNGDEDLEDFNIKITWLQPEGMQERMLEEFNDTTDYLLKAHPRSLNMLETGERVYAINAPAISVDKKLIVTVHCKGMKSGKTIEKTFDLETENQYK